MTKVSLSREQLKEDPMFATWVSILFWAQLVPNQAKSRVMIETVMPFTITIRWCTRTILAISAQASIYWIECCQRGRTQESQQAKQVREDPQQPWLGHRSLKPMGSAADVLPVIQSCSTMLTPGPIIVNFCTTRIAIKPLGLWIKSSPKLWPRFTTDPQWVRWEQLKTSAHAKTEGKVPQFSKKVETCLPKIYKTLETVRQQVLSIHKVVYLQSSGKAMNCLVFQAW